MRVDPRHLRNALAIAKFGTFNRAAEELGMSQPALSKSIVLLEAALNTRLFDRGKRGTRLTEAGRILIAGAHNIENLLERTQQAIRLHERGGLGPLVIGATPSMLLGVVPHAITELSKDYDSLSITVVEGLDGALVPGLQRGEIEILVGPLSNATAAEREFTQIPLIREKFYVSLPPGHEFASRQEINLAELADARWALPTPGSSFYKTIEAMFLAKGVAVPANAISTNSLTMQEQLVKTTGCVCLVTPAQFMGRSVDVDFRPVADGPWRTIGVRHLAEQELSPVAQAFVSMFQSAVLEHDHEGIEHVT